MTVQASAVRRRLTAEQEREREALLTVEETGRQALAEMRRLVGIMRTEEETAALAPQPGLGTLPALVEQVRQSGAAGRAQGGGGRLSLPPGIDLSAYRIVQEALTNTLKHAGPARPRSLFAMPATSDRGRERRPLGRGGRRRRPRARRHAGAGRHVRRRAPLRPAPRRRLSHLSAPAGGRIRLVSLLAFLGRRSRRVGRSQYGGTGPRLERRERKAARGVSVRVLIVDDQTLVRAGFKMILESEPDIEIVGEAEDGLQAIEAVRELRPRRRPDGHPDAEPRRARGNAPHPRHDWDGAACSC